MVFETTGSKMMVSIVAMETEFQFNVQGVAGGKPTHG